MAKINYMQYGWADKLLAEQTCYREYFRGHDPRYNAGLIKQKEIARIVRIFPPTWRVCGAIYHMIYKDGRWLRECNTGKGWVYSSRYTDQEALRLMILYLVIRITNAGGNVDIRSSGTYAEHDNFDCIAHDYMLPAVLDAYEALYPTVEVGD